MFYTHICTTEEPDAVIPHVRVCMGTAQVTGRSTMMPPIERAVIEETILLRVIKFSQREEVCILCFNMDLRRFTYWEVSK